MRENTFYTIFLPNGGKYVRIEIRVDTGTPRRMFLLFGWRV